MRRGTPTWTHSCLCHSGTSSGRCGPKTPRTPPTPSAVAPVSKTPKPSKLGLSTTASTSTLIVNSCLDTDQAIRGFRKWPGRSRRQGRRSVALGHQKACHCGLLVRTPAISTNEASSRTGYSHSQPGPLEVGGEAGEPYALPFPILPFALLAFSGIEASALAFGSE